LSYIGLLKDNHSSLRFVIIKPIIKVKDEIDPFIVACEIVRQWYSTATFTVDARFEIWLWINKNQIIHLNKSTKILYL